ncbi:MAG: DUF5680 domain-containing protein [Candidatus Dojkabacteria bacterium]|nr:DUF5680 domain-containing protein [Candidatus Dojkabacteria bacterium]MDQ7020380.1 DUF5680 domain-containing protein [Candidatus Dojkabacteria bacterium]
MKNLKLIEFLKKSLNNCYLGDLKKAENIERKGFFEMEFSEDDLNYRDSFIGFYLSTGSEIIREGDRPIWVRNYRGGLIDKYVGNKEIFTELEEFLRKCLKIGLQEDGFTPRGPKELKSGDWLYKCNWQGDFNNFKGRETIKLKEEEIFYHDFIGGDIIGKDFN